MSPSVVKLSTLEQVQPGEGETCKLIANTCLHARNTFTGMYVHARHKLLMDTFTLQISDVRKGVSM